MVKKERNLRCQCEKVIIEAQGPEVGCSNAVEDDWT